MKLKHIAAIFVYFATFALSVLIVGLPTVQSRSYKKPCVEKQMPVVSSETQIQVRIRKFLEADFQTGIELANDKARLSHSNNIAAEKLATANLVEKMKKVKCEDLPPDFCAAWNEHVNAWSLMANFLDSDYKIVQGEQGYRRKLNEEISHTYQNLLAAARKYGVDFKY